MSRPKFNAVKEMREHDIIYDPSYIVTSEKDFNKQFAQAQARTAKYGISPIFQNMFSDVPQYPRAQKVIQYQMRMPIQATSAYASKNFANLSTKSQMTTVIPPQPTVQNLFNNVTLFLKSPIIKISNTEINYSKHVRTYSPESADIRTRNVKIQTKYRESSAQTLPWKPENYVVKDNSDPEILKVDFLRNSLPAGMHEIQLIKRARKRREWEKQIPEGFDEKTKQKRHDMIKAIEIDQWAFREQEIQDIQDLRMSLLEKMLQDILDETAIRSEKKLKFIAARLEREKEEKKKLIRKEAQKEMRRLEREYKGINLKYKKEDIIKSYADYSSEVYAPLKRHGFNPRQAHEEIDNKDYQPLLLDIENLNTLPRWIDDTTKMKNKVKLKGRHLCIRETKWTEPVLKQLHEELLNLRNKTKPKCTLRKRIIKYVVIHETLELHADEDPFEKENEAILYLQSIIRGRAVQSMIYEGRDRWRELIEELQTTYPLQETNKKVIHDDRVKVIYEQREVLEELIKKDNMNEVLCQLQGTVIGSLLDFLNKEYRRLLDERKAHAMALMHERERQEREAAEAGKRQVEERRRKEHDEIFKQIMKVHQDTVDLYLQDIVLEGITDVSEEEAKHYIKQLGEKIDEEMKQEENLNYTDKEELIADMVHHFIVPEIQRTFDREKIREKQRQHLINAHDMIFNNIESGCKNEYYSEADNDEDIEEEETKTLNSCTCYQNICVCTPSIQDVCQKQNKK